MSNGIAIHQMAKHNNNSYYMEESVLLGTKPLVDSIRHFIRDQSGVFSVCHNLRSGVPYIFCRSGKVRLIQLLDYLSAAP